MSSACDLHNDISERINGFSEFLISLCFSNDLHACELIDPELSDEVSNSVI